MRNLLVGAVVVLTLAGCAQQVPPPQPLTEQELAQYVQDEQDERWFYSPRSNETRPRVDAVLIHLDEVGGPYNDCILDDEVSDTTCHLTYLYYPHDIGYFSASELSYVYDYFADELVPCLEARGLQVTWAPPRAEFVQAGWMSWDPYQQLGADLPPSRAEAVMAACPLYPPLPFSTGGEG
jgi:hypothetical protein